MFINATWHHFRDKWESQVGLFSPSMTRNTFSYTTSFFPLPLYCPPQKKVKLICFFSSNITFPIEQVYNWFFYYINSIASSYLSYLHDGVSFLSLHGHWMVYSLQPANRPAAFWTLSLKNRRFLFMYAVYNENTVLARI